MQQLSYPLPAVFDPKVGIHEVPDQFAGPQTSMIARLSGTVADRLLDLCPLLHCQSRGTPRDWRTLQPSESRLVKCMQPGAHGLLVPIQPLGNLWATPAIH